jgi:arsenite-transporting ATPase
MSPVELPPDNYFANIQELFAKLDGIGELLEDPKITSVRLVTNPERMVLRETQRAFVYFSLHGLTVDGVIVNRVLPEAVKDDWFAEWRASQGKILEEIEAYFAPVAVRQVPLFTHEVLGRERLEDLAATLYGEKTDPAAVSRTEAPYFKKGDELVVEIGTLRRHIGLPTSMASLMPSRARLENRVLTVEMKES